MNSGSRKVKKMRGNFISPRKVKRAQQNVLGSSLNKAKISRKEKIGNQRRKDLFSKKRSKRKSKTPQRF